MRRSMSPPWDTHAVNCRLSECNPPGVLECGPGLEGIAPVYSVVQQETLQEQHVVDSHSVSTNAKPARWFRSFLSRPHQSRKYAAVAQSIDVRRLLRERGQYGRPGVLTQPGTISRPAGPCGTSAAENCKHGAETQAHVIPLEAVCFALMTPTRHSSVESWPQRRFQGESRRHGGQGVSWRPRSFRGTLPSRWLQSLRGRSAPA